MSSLVRLLPGTSDLHDPQNSTNSGPPYTPPPHSITTATPGPLVQQGQPPQGGFTVLGVRPNIEWPSFEFPAFPQPPAPPGPQVPPATARPRGDDRGASGSGADVTRGLLVRKRNATLLT